GSPSSGRSVTLARRANRKQKYSLIGRIEHYGARNGVAGVSPHTAAQGTIEVAQGRGRRSRDIDDLSAEAGAGRGEVPFAAHTAGAERSLGCRLCGSDGSSRVRRCRAGPADGRRGREGGGQAKDCESGPRDSRGDR